MHFCVSVCIIKKKKTRGENNIENKHEQFEKLFFASKHNIIYNNVKAVRNRSQLPLQSTVDLFRFYSNVFERKQQKRL